MQIQSEVVSPKVVLSFVAIVALFVAFYLSLTRVDTYLRYSAVDACAKQSTYTKHDKKQSADISYPIQDVYQACLKKKGL